MTDKPWSGRALELANKQLERTMCRSIAEGGKTVTAIDDLPTEQMRVAARQIAEVLEPLSPAERRTVVNRFQEWELSTAMATARALSDGG